MRPLKNAISPQERYDRQRAFRPIGDGGQKRLEQALAVVVGCGGLGSHVAEKLARAGVGCLRIIDPDAIEGSNLQRQALYDTEDALEQRHKVEAATKRLQRINPDIQYDPRVERMTRENVASLIEGADVVVDGLDNLAGRFILNDACRSMGIPFVHGGAVGAEGLVMVVLPDEGPCLRCVFEAGPDDAPALTCKDIGIIGSLVQTVGALQATEALKILTGNREAVSRDLVQFDLWNNTWRRIPLSAFPTNLEG